MISIVCRAEEGFNSVVYRQLQSRVRDHLTGLLIDSTAPTLEDIQAITLVAAYSDNGFVFIALAIRFALQMGLPNVVDRLFASSRERSGVVGIEERELYRLSRVWHGICNLDYLYE